MRQKQKFFTPGESAERLEKVIAYLRKEFGMSESKALDYIVKRGIQALRQEWREEKKLNLPPKSWRKPTLNEVWDAECEEKFGR